MSRMTKVYTRTGDDGTTALCDGRRFPKDVRRIEGCGGVDELNSQIGAALAAGLSEALNQPLTEIQKELFSLGSELCMQKKGRAHSKVAQIKQKHIDRLEQLIDGLSGELTPLKNFVLPGGSTGAAQLHVARSVCRRVERLVVGLSRQEPVGAFTVKYLNRLSDLLFVMARYENKQAGITDIILSRKF